MPMTTETASEFLKRLIAIRKLLDDAMESQALLGMPVPEVDASIGFCTDMLATFELQLLPYLSESDQARLTLHLASNRNEYGVAQ